ncbi:hypothetical protein OHS70_36275 [Streptomyces sp. NBC_00390]|uniref:hypothetical protein n=1 Tax=Streptomyces sp. NBC_00390 TaxID=2975736 RepID=UPI002E21ABEC
MEILSKHARAEALGLLEQLLGTGTPAPRTHSGADVCYAARNVPEFGSLSIDVEHPEGVQPGTPVTVRATYAGDLVRFEVPLAPAAEEDVNAEPFKSNGVPTHFLAFDHVVPADWTVSATAGTWSVETTVRVGTRVLAPDGSVEGKRTQLKATVGKPGLVQVVE